MLKLGQFLENLLRKGSKCALYSQCPIEKIAALQAVMSSIVLQGQQLWCGKHGKQVSSCRSGEMCFRHAAHQNPHPTKVLN